MSLTAAAIAILVLTKAFERTGEILGEKVLEQGGKLLSLLKRKEPSTALAIEQAQTQPLDYGDAYLVGQVEAVAKKDPEIAQAVAALASEAQTQISQPKLNEMINQIVIKGVQVKGKATVGDINLEAAREGGVNQQAVVDSEFGDDLNLGNVNLKA